MAATAATAGVVSGVGAAAVQTQPHDQQQHYRSSGAYVIAKENNLQYTPKLVGEQDAYGMRIIALDPENRQ